MTRRKWSVAFAVVLVFVVGICWWFTQTNTGLKAVLRTAAWASSTTIEYEGLQGDFAQFSATSMRIQRGDLQMSLHGVLLVWQPSHLLRKTVNLHEVNLKKGVVNYQSKSSERQPTLDPSDLNLPFDVILRAIRLDELAINQVSFRQLAADVQLIDGQWQLYDLSTNTEWGFMRLSGSGHLDSELTHELSASLAHNEYGPISLTASGNAEQSILNVQLSKLLASGQLTINDILTQPNWQVQFELPDLSAFNQSGELTMRGDGNEHSASLSANGRIKSVPIAMSALDIYWQDDQVQLSGDAMAAESLISIQARIDPSGVKQAQLDIKNISIAPDITLDITEVSIQGDWDQLSAQVNAQGIWVEPLHIESDAVLLGFNQLAITNGMARVLSGNAQFEASLAIADELKGSGRIELSQINPGLFHAELPSSISAEVMADLNEDRIALVLDSLIAKGRVTADNPVAKLITGSGAMVLQANKVVSAQLLLSAEHDEHLSISREPGSAAYDVKMQVRDLGNFVNASSGSIEAEIKINDAGIPYWGKGRISSLSLMNQIMLGAADFSVDQNGDDYSLALVGTDLAYQDIKLTALSLNASGNINTHQFAMETTHDSGYRLAIAGSGSLLDDQTGAGLAHHQLSDQSTVQATDQSVGQWTGTIDSLIILDEVPDQGADQVSGQAQELSLESPTKVHWSDTFYKIEPFCLLSSAKSRVCGQVSASDTVASALVDVKVVANDEFIESSIKDLSTLNLALPEGLSTRLEATMQNNALVESTFELEVPQFTVFELGQKTIALTGLNANAQLNNESVEFQWSGRVGEGALSGHGQLERQAPFMVDARIQLNHPNLDEFSGLLDGFDLASGSTQADIVLDGPLLSPQTTGTMQFKDVHFNVPELGTSLTTHLNINFETQRRARLTGMITSNQETDDTTQKAPKGTPSTRSQNTVHGQAHIEGVFENIPEFEGKLSIIGRQILVANSEDLSMSVTPDLTLSLTSGRTRLTGSLVIDQALSTLQLPALQRKHVLSRDVVIVTDENQQDVQSTTLNELDVVITFGEPAQLKGRGLDAQVSGSLRAQQLPNGVTVADGRLAITGSYQAFGQRLEITSGELLYTRSPLDEPLIQFYAARTVEDKTVGVRVTGRPNALITTMESTPAMPEADVLHYLVLGRAPGSTSFAEQGQLSVAMAALALSRSDSSLQGIGSALGGASVSLTQEIGQLALSVGKQLSPRLWIGYSVGILEPIEVAKLRYQLNDKWSLDAEVSDENRAALKYRIQKN